MMCCKVNYKASLGLGMLESPRDARIDEPKKQSVRMYGREKDTKEKKKKIAEKKINHIAEKDKLTLGRGTYSLPLHSGKRLGNYLAAGGGRG